MEAGRKRARPIVMTTIAMAAGMVPSALGMGDGGGFRSPMAIAVIGGLIVSTMLSLVFVPAVFTVHRRHRPRPVVRVPLAAGAPREAPGVRGGGEREPWRAPTPAE